MERFWLLLAALLINVIGTTYISFPGDYCSSVDVRIQYPNETVHSVDTYRECQNRSGNGVCYRRIPDLYELTGVEVITACAKKRRQQNCSNWQPVTLLSEACLDSTPNTNPPASSSSSPTSDASTPSAPTGDPSLGPPAAGSGSPTNNTFSSANGSSPTNNNTFSMPDSPVTDSTDSTVIGVGVGVGVGFGSIAIIGLVLIGGCVVSKKHLKSKSSEVTSSSAGGNQVVQETIHPMMQTSAKHRVVNMRDDGSVVNNTDTMKSAIQIDHPPVAEPTKVPVAASRYMECEDKSTQNLSSCVVVTNDGVQNIMLKKFTAVSGLLSPSVRSEHRGEATAV